jgi:DNA-binding transcriptional MocR family regulator
VGVPLDDEGIELAALERAIAVHQPRVLYTVPTFHNPTGISMSAARQTALLDLAQRHGLVILEDDVYGMLAYNGAMSLPLKGRDQCGQVIYLTSFSKVLMPGIRIGLLAAPPPLLEPLVAAKRLADMHNPQLLQHTLALYLASGRFAAHVRGVVSLYRERRDCMAQALHRFFPAGTHWTVPDGGLCFWVALPFGVRVNELYRAAIERGVAFTPGHVFFGEQPTQPYLRLSFAAHEPSAIERGVAMLGEVLHEHVAGQRRAQHRSMCDVPLV